MSLQPEQQMDPSTAFANRAADLLQTHQWMDTPTAVALAGQSTTTDQMHTQALAMGQALAQTWDGYEQRFYDPILQAQPSTQYAAVQHLNTVLGPPPATSGITDLQTALNKDGFLKASPSGVWDKQTEDAYNQAVDALKNQQYAGAPKKGGNPFTSTVSHLYHAVIHDVTHPWDAAVGWYDSATEALGYFGGWAGTGFGTLGTASTQAHFSGNITRALGHHVTDQQAAQAYSGSIGQRIENAAGNALSLSVAGGATKAVGKAVLAQAGKQAAKDLAEGSITEADLTKLQKVGLAMSAATKMGFVGRSINDVADALRAGTLPADHVLVQRNLGVVTKTLLRAPLKVTGAADRLPNLVSKEWRDAVPGLARLAPLAEQIAAGANERGWAYRIRNLMAQPYRLAGVRAAGVATQRAEIGALGAHALANALPGSDLAQSVDNAHTGLDSFLDNATWNVLPGVSIGPEDLLLGPLHGDLTGAGRASSVIGDAVKGWNQAIENRLGKLGVDAAFQSILKMDRNELVDMAGSESNLRWWINDKVNQYASDLYTQRQMAASDYTHTFDGGQAAFEDAAKPHRDAWHAMSEDQRAQWVKDLATTDSHYSWLRNRLHTDVLRGAVDPKTAVRASMGEFFTNARDMQDLMDAGLGRFTLGPAGHSQLAAVGATQAPEAVAAVADTLPKGALGLQRADIKTGSEIRADVAAMKTAWENAAQAVKDAQDAASKDAARKARDQILQDGIDYAHVQGNLDASRLGVFANNPDGLWSAITHIASQRAELALPTFDRPDWMTQRINDLAARGYRVVIGSHIGHAYDRTLPSFTQLDGFYRPLRKWLGKAGMDPGRVPDSSISGAIRANQDALVHQLTADPKFNLTTPRADFRTVRAVMQDPTLARKLPPFASAMLGLTARVGLNKTEIARIMRDTGKTEPEARAQLEDAIAAQFGPRDIPRQAIVDNLMTTHDVPVKGGSFTWNGVDAHTANSIVDAYYKGYRLPGFMMGWEGIENWARAARGIGDRMVERHPNSTLINAVNGWPNKLVRARNALRFSASPVFAARVSFKQRYKAALEGVRIPFNPLDALEKQGVSDSALNTLTRLDGNIPREQLDADRYLLSRDVFGIHDSQWDAAYFVHAKREQLEAQTPEVVARVNPNQLKTGEISIFRHHLPEENLDDAATRPTGVYYQTHGPAEVPGAYRYKGRVTTDRAGSSKVPTLNLNTSSYDSNAGYEAIVKLAGRDVARRIQAGAEADPHIVADEIRNRFGVTVSPDDGDGMYLADVYGAALAREAGYKAILFHEPTGTGEFVDLGGATRSVAPPTAAENRAARAAMIEKEVKDAYNRVFKYGADGGRTGLERTVNTIFFPFSFEKTLLRNTGAYLADRPGQALALDLAVEEWRQADKNGVIGQWVNDHLPILREMQLMNAFAHGISPGQFGGINSTLLNDVKGGSEALLNLFLPQAWGPNLTKPNLAKYMPVWGEFKNLWADAAQQQNVVGAAAHDVIRATLKPGWKPEPALTDRAQTSAALRTRALWWSNKDLMGLVDYNDNQASDADKYTWPQDTRLPVEIWDHPINKTTLTDYLHYLYPAYNPDQGALYAKTQAAALTQFIHSVSLTDPGKAQQMAAFRKVADAVVSHINADDYDAATQAQTQEQFRSAFSHMTDPQWKALYSNFYAWALSPIQTPAQKAKAVTNG